MIRWKVVGILLNDKERRMDVLKAMEWFERSREPILQPNSFDLDVITRYVSSTKSEWINLLEFGNKDGI